jgi:arginyl-tRNA synthetase
MIKDSIIAAIQGVLTRRGALDAVVSLVVPEEPTHGDYATSAALSYAKKVGVSPRELAEEILAAVQGVSGVAKAEIAGPGYVNITLAGAVFDQTIQAIMTAPESWGKNETQKGKKVLIEKSAPNLFKPFHVGHLLNLSVGEALSRLWRSAGADVTDVAYPSDISLGVAKAVWSLLHTSMPENLGVHDLGRAYVAGTKAYEEDEESKKEIIEINRKLNAREPGPEYDLYKKGSDINLKYFETVTKRLGSEFADKFFESESGSVGGEIVRAHVGEVFTESNGAIIFEGEKYGLHTRVFVTSLGLPVYEAKDIGLLKLKFEKYNPDVSIVITDIEQKQYFEVLKKAASFINAEWSDRSLYWQHGRMRFTGGKISSRYGNVPLAEDLIDAVKLKVAEKVMESVHTESDEERARLTEMIALGALKYAFLKPAAGHNIVFDFEHSISLAGDSGPYIQYAHARACSIIAAAKAAGVELVAGAPETEDERLVSRVLMQFPDVVARAQAEFAPHHVAQYAHELAATYNTWYAKERVVGDPAAARRAALTLAVAITLKNALNLLGIEAPERM